MSDLLARQEVKLDKSVNNYIENQVVLVTGGGGSIGSELCRQVAKCAPKQLVIFDVYENNAYELENELKYKYGPDFNVTIRIGSVCDIGRLEQVFSEISPVCCLPCGGRTSMFQSLKAAPVRRLRTMSSETLNTAKMAGRYGVSRFVLLSTLIKPVNPTSVMGASKRITEMIVQAVNWHNKTIYAAVRFGNVLGSNGSRHPAVLKSRSRGEGRSRSPIPISQGIS